MTYNTKIPYQCSILAILHIFTIETTINKNDSDTYKTNPDRLICKQ